MKRSEMPRVNCWKWWKHLPHVVASMDLGYEGFVTVFCRGHMTKEDVTLCR